MTLPAAGADPFTLEAINHDVNVIPTDFRIEYRPDRDNPGSFKEVEMVNLVKRGTTGQVTPSSIKKLQNDRILWPFIEPYYEAWKKQEEAPVNGTPLDVLPFLPPTVIQHMKGLNITTAEDLAAVNDSALQSIGMGARRWQDKARAYLDNKGDSMTAEELSSLRQENEFMSGEIAELKAQINSLVADKPKRGRPPKDTQNES